MPKPLTTENILSRIDAEGGINSCWPWLGTYLNNQYGIVGIRSKIMLAHRWSYEHHKEKIPVDNVVRHTCDNPSCCNPLHLITGTQGENIQDAYDRKRRIHPWKISKETLYKIYDLKEKGLMNKQIAAELFISRQVVSKYLNFKKEVPEDWRCRLDQLLSHEK
jgi:hypothetical protein